MTDIFQDWKDPDDRLDWAFHWGDEDADTNVAGDNGFLQGVDITSSVWTVDGPDGLLTMDNPSLETPRTSVVLIGGTEGYIYRVTNQITFGLDALTKSRTIFLEITQG